MQTYEQLMKRKCIAKYRNIHCEDRPMFVGTHIDTGDNVVACMGHEWLIKHDGNRKMIEAVGAEEAAASNG